MGSMLWIHVLGSQIPQPLPLCFHVPQLHQLPLAHVHTHTPCPALAERSPADSTRIANSAAPPTLFSCPPTPPTPPSPCPYTHTVSSTGRAVACRLD